MKSTQGGELTLNKVEKKHADLRKKKSAESLSPTLKSQRLSLKDDLKDS